MRAPRHLVFVAAVAATGVLGGAAGLLTTVGVHAVEHLVFGYDQGSLLLGVREASPERRVLGPAVGCALAGLGWWWLRGRTTVPDLNATLRAGGALAHRPMGLDALLQVLAVGAGASLGREQAPRVFSAVVTDLVVRGSSLGAAERRLLLASATGAGLAAVYDVPLAGVLFTCGIVLRSATPLTVAVATATSVIATLTVWPWTRGAPTFAWPDTEYSWRALVFTLLVVPVAALVGKGFLALTDRARAHAVGTSWSLAATVGAAGLLTGAVSLVMPQLPGNGKSIIEESLSGEDTLLGVAVALVAKPVLTALFLRAGAVGGLLTPALSTGVAAGATVALAVERLGLPASVPTLSLIAGAAVLAVTQRAPVFAAVFTAELTHPPAPVCLLLLLGALGAHAAARASTRWGVTPGSRGTRAP